MKLTFKVIVKNEDWGEYRYTVVAMDAEQAINKAIYRAKRDSSHKGAAFRCIVLEELDVTVIT